MNLIDKYMAEVSKHLPAKGRLDIEAEIRSTIQDMLDDRSQETGQPFDDALVNVVLKEYGDPAKVAATYKPAPYLIGPRLYPAFELVAKLGLTGLGGWAAVILVFDLLNRNRLNPVGLVYGPAIKNFASLIFGGLISVIGITVLIFTILERVLHNLEFDKKESAWDPDGLARRPGPDTVKPIQLTLTVIFTVIWLGILNLDPSKVPLALDVPLVGRPGPANEAFLVLRPAMNVLGVAEVMFCLFLLNRKVWHTGTRLAGIALKLAEMALAMFMVQGPFLREMTLWPVTETWLPSRADLFMLYFSSGYTLILVMVIAVNTFQIVLATYQLFARRPASAFLVIK